MSIAFAGLSKLTHRYGIHFVPHCICISLSPFWFRSDTRYTHTLQLSTFENSNKQNHYIINSNIYSTVTGIPNDVKLKGRRKCRYPYTLNTQWYWLLFLVLYLFVYIIVCLTPIGLRLALELDTCLPNIDISLQNSTFRLWDMEFKHLLGINYTYRLIDYPTESDEVSNDDNSFYWWIKLHFYVLS